MLVNYTGAAGDLPGEIPRKIGPRGRKIHSSDFWPWSEKLHFVMPGAFGRSVRSPAGPAQLTHLENQQSLILDVLGGSVRGTRSPSLTSFLSHISHVRVNCEKTGLCTKSTQKQTDCQTPLRGQNCLSASKN